MNTPGTVASARHGVAGFGGPVALCQQMGTDVAQGKGRLTRDEMHGAIALMCLGLPVRSKVSKLLTAGGAAVAGLVAFSLLQPAWVLVR